MLRRWYQPDYPGLFTHLYTPWSRIAIGNARRHQDLDLSLRPLRQTPSQTSEPPSAKRLRRSVADLVLETTAESIWLIDAEARTTFVNRRLARLLGYTEEEMIGRPIFDFLDKARWETARQNLQSRKRGRESRDEVELLRKDGTRVWVITSANPVFDHNGEYAGALAILGDFMPQKERERLLQKQITDLRARLAGRLGVRSASRDVPPADAEPARVREPFRTALVMATFGTLFATVAVATAGGVVSSLLAQSRKTTQDRRRG
jgi:PAS domain S-box-containing protein